ncbi:MAG TPA: hypothetical protein VGS79_00310 [Puia sp.]|nr:hypothetical protein [Puia sp.]
MKAILFFLIAVGLMSANASAQEIMQFTFIGNAGGSPDSIIVTSVQEFKMNGVEVVHMDNRIVDSLRRYILQKYSEGRSGVASAKDTVNETLNALTYIKVTGVDSMPLYFSKKAFSDLVFSAMRYFDYTGPTTSRVLRFALLRLEYLGQERFFHHSWIMDSSARVDPRLRVKG